MVTVPPARLVTGTWREAVLVDPAVEKAPPEATVMLPDPPLMLALPDVPDSSVRTPPLLTKLGAPKVRVTLPAVELSRTVWVPLVAPPTSSVLTLSEVANDTV